MAYSDIPSDRYYYRNYGPYARQIERSDEELRDEIVNRLVWDSWVDANQVHVEVKGGIAALTGEVDTVVEKRAAGDDAWDTPGVLDVENLLRVRMPVGVRRPESAQYRE